MDNAKFDPRDDMKNGPFSKSRNSITNQPTEIRLGLSCQKFNAL